jgi:thiol-disulfide isomerase/thioredoxin
VKRLAKVGIVAAALVVAVGGFVFVEQDAILGRIADTRYAQRWIDGQLADDGTPWVRIGDRLPPFARPALSGTGEVRVPVAGHWTVVNYWASWCGPCRREMPLLAAIAANRQGAPAVVGIALELPENAREFVLAHPPGYPSGVEWPVLEGKDSSVPLGDFYGVLPASFLIDPQGRLQHRRIGPFRDADDLHRWLRAGGMPAD